MIRPIIGVTGGRRRGRILGAFASLSLWLHGARYRRLIPPLDLTQLDGLHGVIIGGGDDIGATLYDGVPAPDVRIDKDRDEMEQQILWTLWSRQTPILGICRGAQMINVFLGGRLHQDIYAAYADAPRMRTPLPRKSVDLEQNSYLRSVIGEDSITVNSLHSQSISGLGEEPSISARDEYGIVQAVEWTGKRFRVGVQWHPELLFYRSAHRRLFREFVAQARFNMRTVNTQ